MRDYIWHGKQYQFDEQKAPADAVPVDEAAKTLVHKAVETVKKALKPEPVAEVKAEKPRSKMRKVANK